MKNKPSFLKPSWDKSFGKKPRTHYNNHSKIIANPGFIFRVLSQKKIVVFLAYVLLIALTMLNLANYKWAKETQLCSLGVRDNVNLPNRPSVHVMVKPPPVKKRQLVYVLTTWRSGSSFFGELFNQNPRVFFLYEPMWHIWQKLYPGDALSLQGAARDMLSALYNCDLSVFQLYNTQEGKNVTTMDIFGAPLNKVICSYPLCPHFKKEVVGMVDNKVCNKCPRQSLRLLEEQCRKYDTIVIKGVRVFDIGLLAPLMEDPSLNLKVVHLVRDPRAIANSRIKSKNGLLRESLQVIRSSNLKMRQLRKDRRALRRDGLDYHAIGAMELICERMSQSLKTVLSHPSWLKDKYVMVRYEDLVENPVSTIKRVYNFVNLTLTRDIEAFVVNMTSGRAKSARPFQVSSRNATIAASTWRTVLTAQQIRQVEDYCHLSMAVLGYVRVRANWEARDLTKSLLAAPKV